MNENNQQKQGKEENPKAALGARSAVKSTGWKKVLSKKWISPAAFIAAAAIIVTLMWHYQGAEQSTSTTESTDPATVTQGVDTTQGQGGDDQTPPKSAPTVAAEQLQWPVDNFKGMVVQTHFYDANGTEEEHEAALVQDGNTFVPSTGIDITSSNGQPFDVMAAAKGTVTLVDNHPTNGNEVEITAPSGLVMLYQSLEDVNVKVGDEVAQGTVIAKSGRNEAGKDLGNHLRYTTVQDGVAVNPESLVKN